MMRKFGFITVAALVTFGQVGAAYADTTTGLDSNRAALGLPVQARVGSCVYGSECGSSGNSGSSDLAGGVAIVPLIAALGVVAGAATLVAVKNHHHDYHYAPVSP